MMQPAMKLIFRYKIEAVDRVVVVQQRRLVMLDQRVA